MKISDSFHLMAKPNGPKCNMDCIYCFYLEKEKLYFGKNNWKMSDEVLENYIRQYIQSQKSNTITFAWQGGEPTLLGIDFFKKSINMQKKYSNGKIIENTLQTNGVMLNDAWCSFFSENDFLIGLSIDGPREIHDKYRTFKSGHASFDKVVNGIECMKKHGVEFNTLTCVQRDNSCKPLEVYNFLKEIGSKWMQFIPVVERVTSGLTADKLKLVSPDYLQDAKVTEWSVRPLQYGKFLTAIFDKWIRNDVGSIFIQLFDISLELWYLNHSNLCIFQETCGNALAIEHNGDIYSCDHYVYPQNKLGNIMDTPLKVIVNSEKQQLFGINKKANLPKYCRNCKVKFACNGECPKHRFLKSPDGEYGLNYLCEGYKHFFNYIDIYMNFMSEELKNKRPPANVMSWIHEKEKHFPSLKIGRNEPCLCGSGKKYKKCCG
jgi:uncharacterized protein